MASAPASLFSFVDAGRDVGNEEAPVVATVASWGALLGTGERYGCAWRWDTQEELQERRSVCQGTTASAAALERARIKARNELKVGRDKASCASSASEEEEEGREGKLDVHPDDLDDVEMGEEDDVEGGGGVSGYSAMITSLRRELDDHAKRRRTNGGAAPAPPPPAPPHRAGTQARIILYVQPSDSNRLCLTPCPTPSATAAKRHSSLFFIDVDRTVGDAADDHTAYTGGTVAILRQPNAIFEETKPLLWPSMVTILNRCRLAPQACTNVRLRIRLGRKCLLSRGGSSQPLIRAVNNSAARSTAAWLEMKAGAADEAAAAEDSALISAEGLCRHLNTQGGRGMEFLDSISKAEFTRIREAVAPHIAGGDTVVLQLHGRMGRGRRCVDCRMTCAVAPADGALALVKVKVNSRKYTTIDVIRPEAYDFRYDIRTTDSAPASTDLHKDCAALVECFTYDAGANGLKVLSEDYNTVAFSMSTLRLKRKAKYVVPAVAAGGEAVKVSLSHTTQHDVSLHDGTRMPVGGVVPSTASDRYEAGAQLVSTKRVFDALKGGEAPQNLPSHVLELARALLPNALAALQQIPTAEAARLFAAAAAVQLRQQAQRERAAAQAAAAEAASDDDDDDDMDEV